MSRIVRRQSPRWGGTAIRSVWLVNDAYARDGEAYPSYSIDQFLRTEGRNSYTAVHDGTKTTEGRVKQYFVPVRYYAGPSALPPEDEYFGPSGSQPLEDQDAEWTAAASKRSTSVAGQVTSYSYSEGIETE